CTAPGGEELAASSSQLAGDVGVVQVTHYTLARERDFGSQTDFLCSGRGVAIIGAHVDVYTEDDVSVPAESQAFVTSEPHEPTDPGPRGEAAAADAPA